MLEISFRDDGEVVLSGRFDAAQEDKAMDAFDSITSSCVIDMANLEYISSAGLGVLLATYKRLSDRGQSMVLKNMNKHIRRIFQLSGLEKIFIIE